MVSQETLIIALIVVKVVWNLLVLGWIFWWSPTLSVELSDEYRQRR
jgi:hypothetical protein